MKLQLEKISTANFQEKIHHFSQAYNDQQFLRELAYFSYYYKAAENYLPRINGEGRICHPEQADEELLNASEYYWNVLILNAFIRHFCTLDKSSKSSSHTGEWYIAQVEQLTTEKVRNLIKLYHVDDKPESLTQVDLLRIKNIVTWLIYYFLKTPDNTELLHKDPSPSESSEKNQTVGESNDDKCEYSSRDEDLPGILKNYKISDDWRESLPETEV